MKLIIISVFVSIITTSTHGDDDDRFCKNVILVKKESSGVYEIPAAEIEGRTSAITIQCKHAMDYPANSVNSEIDFIIKSDNEISWNQSLERNFTIKVDIKAKHIELSELTQTTCIEHEGWTAYSRLIPSYNEKCIRMWSVLVRGKSADVIKFDGNDEYVTSHNYRLVTRDGVTALIVYLGEIEIVDYKD